MLAINRFCRWYLLGALLILAALFLAARPTSADHVTPFFIPGNPNCDNLAPPGVEWLQFKIQPVEDGTYSNGSLTITLDVYDVANGEAVDWSANAGVDAVFAKGGPGGNLYLYDPPGPLATADSGLHAPLNPANGKFHNLGHLLFCTVPLPTLTPPPTDTATMTPAPSATSSPSATPTATPTTSPTPPGESEPTATPPSGNTATPRPTGTIEPTPTAIPTEQPHQHMLCLPLLSFATLSGEPNDSCEEALPILPDVTHHFLPDDKHDWYTFDLHSSGHLVVELTNFLPKEGQLAVYKGDDCSNATILCNSDTCNNGEPGPTKILDLGPQGQGRYYLYISNDGAPNTSEPYQLSIHFP